MNENIDKEWTLHFLTIVARNGNINELLYGDYDVSYMLRSLRIFEADGVIEHREGRFVLTERGIHLSCTLQRQLGLKAIYRFVMPDRRYRLESMSVDDIYVPRKRVKKELKF